MITDKYKNVFVVAYAGPTNQGLIMNLPISIRISSSCGNLGHSIGIKLWYISTVHI